MIAKRTLLTTLLIGSATTGCATTEHCVIESVGPREPPAEVEVASDIPTISDCLLRLQALDGDSWLVVDPHQAQGAAEGVMAVDVLPLDMMEHPSAYAATDRYLLNGRPVNYDVRVVVRMTPIDEARTRVLVRSDGDNIGISLVNRRGRRLEYRRLPSPRVFEWRLARYVEACAVHGDTQSIDLAAHIGEHPDLGESERCP